MKDYWVVIEKSTGRVIAHCGEERDAVLMVSFDNHNRIYRKQKFLMDQVINVSSSGIKELPGQQGLPAAKINLPEEKEVFWCPELPEGTQIPLNTK